MAIYHLHMKPISRAKGRSSVAAAAYRAGVRLEDRRTGNIYDFSNRSGVVCADIILPKNKRAAWAFDREALWNCAELTEKRKDGRTAREIEISLPCELSHEQREKLTRNFVQHIVDRYDVAADFAIHLPHRHGDDRNHHVHILITTRTINEYGLDEKTPLEMSNSDLKKAGLQPTQIQLLALRREWAEMANEALREACVEVEIDHRSFKERGIDLTPTSHMGVQASHTERQGGEVERQRLTQEAADENAAIIEKSPEQILALITNEKSVFNRRDVARTLHRYIDDNQLFQDSLARVMGADSLICLEEGEGVDQSRYTTKEMYDVEVGMVDRAKDMAERKSHTVDPKEVYAALQRQNAALKENAGASLSSEQINAVRHITRPNQISSVIGLAGAGKSTALYAAREAWEAQGYTVKGAALSGKAAEALYESSGIESRTLASYQMSWKHDKRQLNERDVFVIDEAGMVGSRQMAEFIEHADLAGAKIVMVGDPQQLQAINAGAPFRAISEEIGAARLEEVRRQRDEWQRDASKDFAAGQAHAGLRAYSEKGQVHFEGEMDQAKLRIVEDYIENVPHVDDCRDNLIFAHRRKDVADLNALVRLARQQRGELQNSTEIETAHGVRDFAVGDRFLFTQNNTQLDVKNGMLGTVRAFTDDHIQVVLDKHRSDDRETVIDVPYQSYSHFDHGYTLTIHKGQGATVDHSYVLASRSMDKHLAYVGMTRHHDSTQVYAARSEFRNLDSMARTFGRENAKEVVMDYDLSEQIERFEAREREKETKRDYTHYDRAEKSADWFDRDLDF